MTIAILGLGKTGQSLVNYFSKKGEVIFGIDDRSELGTMQDYFQSHTQKLFLAGELPAFESIHKMYLSPGVPLNHPAIQKAQKAQIEIQGELDLATSLCTGNIIAITGTNGKSTTTALVGEMLKASDQRVGIGGNLGTPFLDLVTSPQSFQTFVIEVSSFQLETAQQFHPHIAALLNLSEDHLDWHDGFEGYVRAKQKIFLRQNNQDFAVFNDGDIRVLEAIKEIPSQKMTFSVTRKVSGVYSDEKKVFWAPNGLVESEFDLAATKLPGIHNLENICAAIACAKLAGAHDEAIRQTLKSFQGLPHRIQWVANINQVDYFNDSKATNVGAVAMSLASFDQDVVLIMGGKDKGGDYQSLNPLLRAKASAVILLGEAAERMESCLKNSVSVQRVSNMQQAVQMASQVAPKGGTVLLSPACSSFDMFKNFEERGRIFKEEVKRLQKDGG